MDEIEQLLRQGKTVKELIKAGYAKSTVYAVKRRLDRAKAAESEIDTVIEVFKLYDQGYKPGEVVLKLRIDPDKALSLFEKWKNLNFINEVLWIE